MDKFQFYAALISLLFSILSNFFAFKRNPTFFNRFKYLSMIVVFVSLVVWVKELAKFSTILIIIAAATLIKFGNHGRKNNGTDMAK